MEGGFGLQELRKSLRDALHHAGTESPAACADQILMHVLHLDKTQLLLGRNEVSAADYETAYAMAKRRIGGEPMQYILGHCLFMDLDFVVNRSTLIPRPETELLVETVLGVLPKEKKINVWDIGSGSGCIGISLAHYNPNISVAAIDCSAAALEVTALNAKRCGVDARMTTLCLDIMKDMPDVKTPDVIVSNPPYIRRDVIGALQREVRDFEPMAALDGGVDGLDFYRRIVSDAPLQSGGLLAFEIGYDQGGAVAALMERQGFLQVTVKKDYADLDRIVFGYRKS